MSSRRSPSRAPQILPNGVSLDIFMNESIVRVNQSSLRTNLICAECGVSLLISDCAYADDNTHHPYTYTMSWADLAN